MKTEKELNYRDFPFRPDSISGRRSYLRAYRPADSSRSSTASMVRSSPPGATVDLCSVMPDSGHIQEMEVGSSTGATHDEGRAAVEAIYTAEDATACLTSFRPVAYEEWTIVAPGLRAGSGTPAAFSAPLIEMEVAAAGADGHLLFSGDIGPDHKLLQFDPEAPQGFDYVICESTYGDTDRDDASPGRRLALLREEVLSAAKPSGACSFRRSPSSGQELLVDLIGLSGREDSSTPVFIDSPLATKASAIFANHAGEIEDGEALERAPRRTADPVTETVEQSKAIDGSQLHMIAASGMCEAGRIRHHLKAWLCETRRRCFSSASRRRGRSDRSLLDGAPRVRLMGEECGCGRDPLARPLFGACRQAGTVGLDEEETARIAERLPGSWKVAAIEGLKERFPPGPGR